jgi:WD40 repeat protein
VAWTASGTAHLVDARSGRPAATLQGGFGVPAAGAAAATGGRVLLAWSEDSGLGVRPVWEAWDLRTGEILGIAEVPGQVQLGGTTTEDGAIGVWSGADMVETFRPATEETIARREDVVAAAVSPTGLVAASTSDGRLAFLRAPSLRPTGNPLPGTPGAMQQLTFSSDGRTLAARGGDGTVRVVDVHARTQLGEPIEVGAGTDRRIALRPDGRELVLSTGRGLSFWDLRVRRWRAEACRLAGRNLTRGEWSAYLSAVGDYRRTCSA